MNTAKPRIGLIGVGLMGSGIAASLLRNNYPLTVLEHPGNQPLEPLLQAGANTAQQASELAAGVDIIILCVTGTPQVEEVLFSENGVMKGLKPGAIVIDCSTAIPSSTPTIPAVEQSTTMADRKSTRLNSSHVTISYAVFCWKKR